MLRARTLLLAAVLLPVLATACVDECDPDTYEDHCEDGVHVFCPMAGVDQLAPIRIRRKTCPEVCVELPAGGAFCAVSPEPAPVCDGVRGEVCEDATHTVYCAVGYATERYACLSCTPGDPPECEGGLFWDCTSDADCVDALHCSESGYCATP